MFRKTSPTVPMDTTVAGVIDSGDVDCVAVAMRKGMRFSAEVQAVRLGGEMTDTLMTILGPDGRVLATADDPPMTGQDPFATLVAPADGLYTIQIRETSYGEARPPLMRSISETFPGRRASSRRAARRARRCH